MNKVLLISLQKRGGGAIDALGLSNGLCDNRFLHDIVISDGNELSADFTESQYRHVIKTSTYGSSAKSFILNSVLLVRPIGFIVKVYRAKPSIVHITHFHPWVILVFLLRPFTGYKIIYAVHEDPYARKDKGNPLIMGPLERMFIKKADVVAAYSDYMNGVLARHIPGNKIKTILLGAYDTFCPDFMHKGFNKSAALKLLFFGAIKEFKGVDVLVDAMEICKKKGLNVKLTIAGKQETGSAIISEERTRSLGITWINKFSSRQEICELLAMSDAMVIPYKKATQTSPGSLAIACGMPVIATKSGGLAEQVEDGVNGLLAKPNDAESLAAAIEKICSDRSLIQKFHEGARKLYETKFSWKIITEHAIREIYDKMR
jgi:glycosyltransferase involved in cell wall biosynthesis